MPVLCKITTKYKLTCDKCKIVYHSRIVVLDGTTEFEYCEWCDVQFEDIDVVFEYYTPTNTLIQMYALDNNIIDRIYRLKENMITILGSTVPVKL